MTLITRAQWGARAPTSTGNTISAHPLGVAVHYSDGNVGNATHDTCAGSVRSIQAYHIDSKGWADIAYNFLACQHGYLFEGRGLGKGSAANGTTQANLDYYAVCGLIGPADTPTPQLVDGIGEGVALCRAAGADRKVIGHRDVFATSCPGDSLYALVQDGRWSGFVTPPATHIPTPKPVQEDDMLALILWAYTELVGRTTPPSTDEVTNWVSSTPGWTSAQTLAAFLGSQCEPGGVVKAYKDILGRAPESQAVIDGHLATKPTIRQVRYDLSISAEAKLRAGK